MTEEEKKERDEIVKILSKGILTDDKLNEAIDRLYWLKYNRDLERKPVFKEIH